MNNQYIQFYETQDRENVYSAGLEAEKHKFFNSLVKVKALNKVKNPKVLEIGAGNGRFQDVFDDYTGIDITENSRKYFNKSYFVVEDGKSYPFEDGVFDIVFTNAVFEHIPDIDTALKEMIRVVKTGGIILFNPAWQCRPWAAKGYQVRSYSDFDIWGKLHKLSIPIRENIVFRLLHVMPKRLFHLLRYTIEIDYGNKLIFSRLQPNYEIFWQSDSDACNSIDPFMAILYFKSNGLKIVNYPTVLKQLFVRTNELLLEK